MRFKVKIYDIIWVLFINAILFIVLLLCLECFFRLSGTQIIYKRTYPGEYENRKFSKKRSWQEDAYLGWVFNTQNPVKSKNGVIYKANREGFRDDKDFSLTAAQVGKKRVMVLGDSMVFGAFLEKQDTIPQLLQQDLGDKYLTYNFGVSGWGIDQMYLAYQKYSPVIKPNIVILFFIDDDILRSFEAYRNFEKMNKPSFKISHGELVLREKKDQGFIEQWEGKSYVLNKLLLLYRNFYSKKIAELAFKKMIQGNKNIKFIIVRIPLVEDIGHYGVAGYRQFSFKGVLRQDNISYIELNDYMEKLPRETYGKFYIPHDGHFSKEGTAFVAQIVYKFCY